MKTTQDGAPDSGGQDLVNQEGGTLARTTKLRNATRAHTGKPS